MDNKIGLDVVRVRADGEAVAIDVLFWAMDDDGKKKVFAANTVAFQNAWSQHIFECIKTLVAPQVEESFGEFVPLIREGEGKDLWTFVSEKFQSGASN